MDARGLDGDNSGDDDEHTFGGDEPPLIYPHLMDSKTSKRNDALSEKLDFAFQRQSRQFLLHDISKISSEYDPIDLAYAVIKLPPKARTIVYDNLPDLNAKIIFMINTGNSTRAAIFRHIDDAEIKMLLENMPPDEAVSLLDDLSERKMKRVFDILDPKKCTRIRELHNHESHTAGRLMTNEFFAFHMNVSIGEVAAVIRDNPGIDLTRCIFVLSGNGELTGYVPGRALIVNPRDIPLRQVMRPVLHTVTADASRDEVVDIVERYEIPALPVVDDEDRLVGVITNEDVVELLEDIADETIATMAGTGEDVSEHEPTLKRVLWRAPWLLVTLCAGLVSFTALTHFSDRIWFAIVPFFVPLINMMSGNVGLQCSTVLVRGMSTGELSARSRRKAVFKELLIGLTIGSSFGIFCGCIVYFLSNMGFYHLAKSPFELGVTIGFGVLGACMTATTLGAFSPFLFAKLRIDPAVAAGPIVTAFNDVLSTLVFFFIARCVNTLLHPI